MKILQFIPLYVFKNNEVTTAFHNEARLERTDEDNKLSAHEIAHSIVSVLEMDDKGFITELNVWATNPF